MKKLIIILTLTAFSIPLFAENTRLRVGVLDFKANNISKNDAQAINDMFISELVTSGYYDVIDRKNIEALLKEKELELSEISDSANAVKVGKILSLQYMVYGSVSKLGKSYVLTVYLINVETGHIINSAREKFYVLEQSYRAVQSAVARLTGKESGNNNTASEKKSAGKMDFSVIKKRISIELGGGGVLGDYESGVEIETAVGYMFGGRWGAGSGIMIGLGENGVHFGMNLKVYYKFGDSFLMSFGLRGFPGYTNSFGGPSVGIYLGNLYGRLGADIVDGIGISLDFGYRRNL